MEVPLIGKKPLGPIHTLIRDGKGRVYLSDEINHRVLCLTEQGELLWLHGADAADPIRFRYPRGLALGRISTDNAGLADCLAVCDSWNNRVVFLSLGSGQIGEWRRAGDLPLREVSDIRYIEHPRRTAEGVQDCWLLLDRGNQRLCWLGLDGQLLTHIGSEVGPQTAPNSRFPVFESMAEKFASPIPKAFPPYNLLHHPSRIIGTRQLLAVSESLGPSLKLIRDGFLYPLPLKRACDTWLALDDFGFLGWEKADRVLVYLDLDGTESLRTPTHGVPVFADLGDREWWEQQGQTLSRHSFPDESKQKSAGIWQQLAALEIASIDFAETEAALDDYLECLRRLLTLANEVLLLLGQQGQPSQGLLDETRIALQLKIEPFKRSLEILGTSAVKWRVCCLDASEEIPDSSVPQFQSFFRRVENSLNTTFIALVASLDRLVLAGADFTADNNLNDIRFNIDAALWPAGKFLADSYNLLQGADRIFRPSQAGSRKTDGLKEVDRWKIEGPKNLALTKNGTISISISQSNAIVEMDPRRETSRTIDPASDSRF